MHLQLATFAHELKLEALNEDGNVNHCTFIPQNN